MKWKPRGSRKSKERQRAWRRLARAAVDLRIAQMTESSSWFRRGMERARALATGAYLHTDERV